MGGLTRQSMDMLVSTEWLAGELGNAGLIVIDASAHLPSAGRDPAAEYAAGHIPGARYLDLPSLKDTTSPVPNAIPTREQLEGRMRALGANAGDRIIVYDDSMVKTSARAWFMLRHHGYDNVAILDGGLTKWKAEGRRLEAGTSEQARGDFALAETRPIVRSKSDVLRNIDSAAEQVIDARDRGRFSGEVEDTVHNLPSGHIPGSCNLFFGDLFNGDGTFIAPDAIERAFRDAGIDPDAPIMTTCGSGVTACVLLFALALTGRDGVLYDGSWSEWGADPETPKARGLQ